ncbi:EAL domain-containing protein [Sphingomonas sp. ID1715]|uniref:EAL domain-containing protein n=1 Tax=Sphingomonas sp. ID1715 TaxID=1656898 RepID=UPI00148A0535|nr:EAL domain-containing protein [Sphingomonas sp. ID1715]NNM76541.1 EAL domain-containing protein [Sphingomonas sp. ID1715]
MRLKLNALDGSAARTGVAVLALGVALLVWLSGIGAAIDRAVEPLRFSLWPRNPSGQLVIVELDAASAAAIKRWPWPRDHYAAAVDRLREAGAASIVFDVDFSSPATADGDAAFAAALARADGLVALPTFAQQATARDRRSIDNLPLPALREHVALASVSIAPDPDGTVRSAPFATITGGMPRPSLSAYIAGMSGQADRSFPIDYSIDAQRIPRLSFIDVRNGRFDPALVKGRQVLVGATAIEMGDRYATPRFGVLPGVVVQALAAETLIAGMPVALSEPLALALALLLALPVLRSTSTPRCLAYALAAPLLLILAAMMLQGLGQLTLPIGGPVALLLTAASGRLGLRIRQRFETQKLADAQTDLPNRTAMLLADNGDKAAPLAVLQITNFESLLAVLGAEAEASLVLRIAERARFFAQEGQVYRVADRLLAFRLSAAVEDSEAMSGMRTLMLQPVEVLGRRVDAAIALGIVDGEAATGLAQAALAAEQAAAAGVFWRRFDGDQAALSDQVSLMGELDSAIASGRIRVFYQPKMAIASGRITSCEALVRWDHEIRGLLGPDLFIGLAEQTDRIAPLTLCVIEQVLHDLARWHAAGLQITAAVNISARLLASEDFNDRLCALLARGIAPSTALVFEVTESAALADSAAAAETLVGYRQLGIAISIDDYGTGQSTLSYLRQLPVSELKIDRSFVQNAHLVANDAVLVRSTVQMAHELGLKVVAEGVETEECLAFLREIGCDLAQGYLISRPIPAEPFQALLAGDGRRAAA